MWYLAHSASLKRVKIIWTSTPHHDLPKSWSRNYNFTRSNLTTTVSNPFPHAAAPPKIPLKSNLAPSSRQNFLIVWAPNRLYNTNCCSPFTHRKSFRGLWLLAVGARYVNEHLRESWRAFFSFACITEYHLCYMCTPAYDSDASDQSHLVNNNFSLRSFSCIYVDSFLNHIRVV